MAMGIGSRETIGFFWALGLGYRVAEGYWISLKINDLMRSAPYPER